MAFSTYGSGFALEVYGYGLAVYFSIMIRYMASLFNLCGLNSIVVLGIFNQ